MAVRGFCECGCGQRTRLAPYTSGERGWVIGEPVRFVKAHVNRRHPRIRRGDVFGRLVVVEDQEYGSNLKVWCRCECGADRMVYAGALRGGDTKGCGSCGRHGFKGTRTYNTWRCMNRRCDYPGASGFERYGGRGIEVCDRWRGRGGFESFLADMGERPEGKTLDRIDCDGNYEPGNCRWATPKEQIANRRPKVAA